MAKPEFKTARWIYSVSDQQTGEVLLANRPDELVFTASTAKNFTVGSVYAAVGPDATLTALQVTPSPSDAAAITVSGTIAGGASQVTIYRVPDAATWARTLFVEALTRAGVDVTSPAVGPNNEASLPAKDSYPAEARVAALTSPPLEAFGTMILKTSWNTGANALMCLMAAETGSTECIDGLKTVHVQINNAGLVANDVILLDGQGADPASTTPAQMAAWMRWAKVQPWGPAFVAGQPVLGVDGTLASAGQDSPAKGKVAAKTGTSVALDPTTNRVYYKVQSLAG
jgi:serine-type D-Ala-D-Ala carboxypeptidase/endopeptidase (penicillin-binding protein 4)